MTEAVRVGLVAGATPSQTPTASQTPTEAGPNPGHITAYGWEQEDGHGIDEFR